MRPLVLYLRSRRVPTAVAAAAASVALLWSLDQTTDHRTTGLVATLAVVAATAAFGTGLAGHDRDLDRSAALAWPPWRAAHVVAAGAIVVGLVAATTVTGERLATASHVIRDTAGMTGLLALGAAALGAGRAWILPLTAALLGETVAPRLGPPPLDGYQQALTWTHQPTTSTTAAVTAAALGATGVLVYAIAGPRT
ncbi:hypothetical protein RB614_27720 [Phytohabitans sp. ZYX-F-186]|uniref:Uncharacterized protein n=1 Tax=Phytohabitans maris TaxID=3071409 RepID=A0ABU0ZMR8_9ACTN|nr:hypothetical protein [Phytohabitans sp. ZYX-F-186]MDQ7908321.1 hypothetical protein [Phytohabitans sp. ZYX-F-186]